MNEQSVDGPSAKRLNLSCVSMLKSVLWSYPWFQKLWPLGKELWYFMPDRWSWERQQKLQSSSTEGWLYLLLQKHSPFNLKDESFVYRLGRRFQRVKYDSLLNRAYKIKSYLAITDEHNATWILPCTILYYLIYGGIC